MKRFCILLFIIFCGTPAIASTFNSTQSLSFGTLIPTTTSGSVVVAQNGSINTGPGMIVAPSGPGYSNGAALYNGTGLGGILDILIITFLSSSATLTNGAGGTVTVNNFNAPTAVGVNLLMPSAVINIGATMNFTAASTPGTYTGSIQIRAARTLAFTEPALTATIPITLTIWRRLSVSQSAPLNFGSIQVMAGDSTVRIAPQTGARSVVSGGTGISLITADPGGAGAFNITGNPNTIVSIQLPSSINLTGAGTAMVVNNFSAHPSSTSATLSSAGTLELKVGADLKINTNQAGGTYNGTYNVTINY